MKYIRIIFSNNAEPYTILVQDQPCNQFVLTTSTVAVRNVVGNILGTYVLQADLMHMERVVYQQVVVNEDAISGQDAGYLYSADHGSDFSSPWMV